MEGLVVLFIFPSILEQNTEPTNAPSVGEGIR